MVHKWKSGFRALLWRSTGHPAPPQIILRRVLWLLFFIATAQVAGLLGTYFTVDAIPTWYAQLAKPSFAPPNWIFAPVWTILYTLMGIATFIVWEKRHHKTAAYRALNWYWFQLALNALWTPVFFGAKAIGLAFVVIVLLWICIIATLREFWKVGLVPAILLVPYFVWVSFASVLNYSLWALNQ